MALQPTKLTELNLQGINNLFSNVYELLSQILGYSGEFPGSLDMGGKTISNAVVDGYLKTDGSVAMTGNLDLSNNELISAVTENNLVPDAPQAGQKKYWEGIEYFYNGATWVQSVSSTSLSSDNNTETLTGNKTLVVADAPVQLLDPDGTDRDVIMPAESDSTNLMYWVGNTSGADELLVIKNDSGTVIISVGWDECGWLYCNGSTWYRYRMFVG